MCLHIKGDYKRKNGFCIPRTAKNDMIVYKRLGKNADRKYETPFRGTIVNIGSKGTRMKAEFTFGFLNPNAVHQGIHAYYNKKTAIRKSEQDYNGVVVECIIPKGAKYFKGRNQDIVATEMKLGKIVYRAKN
jgi:hypothetical protein